MSSTKPPAERGRKLREQFGAALMRLRGGALSPGRAAASVAAGLFVGCTPLYGGHIWLVLAVCLPLRLDAAVAYVAAHVSNPLTLPLLFTLELEVGSVVLRGRRTELDFDAIRRAGFLAFGADITMGALIVGAAFAGLGAIVTFVLVLRVWERKHRGQAEARRRTLARYRSAPRRVRGYVTGKLLVDPALDVLASISGSFGRIVDAGAGYGHVSLSLLEEGRASTVFGVDSDAARVAVATDAARGASATFVEGSIVTAKWPEADTFLFLDCLHYLPLATQDAALARAAAVLARGGRIVVRDVDAHPGFRSWLTQWLERRAARRRGQEGLAFRPADDLARALSALGFECDMPGRTRPGTLEDVVIVGTKR